MKSRLHIGLKYVGNIGPIHARSLVGGSIFVSPHGCRLVDFLGLLMMSLTPLPPSNLPLTLLQGSQDLSDVRL